MLHTHEATGSSPVVSTKNHRNRLIPVIFFYNLQLFWTLNFRRFFKTHTLTHTGKGAESTGQGLLQNRLTKDAGAKGLSLTFCPPRLFVGAAILWKLQGIWTQQS